VKFIDAKIADDGTRNLPAASKQIECDNYVTGANHAGFAIYCLRLRCNLYGWT